MNEQYWSSFLLLSKYLPQEHKGLESSNGQSTFKLTERAIHYHNKSFTVGHYNGCGSISAYCF